VDVPANYFASRGLNQLSSPPRKSVMMGTRDEGFNDRQLESNLN